MENPDNLFYVSLGAVLSQDDSFIDLLDRKPGVAFIKDETGKFVELD